MIVWSLSKGFPGDSGCKEFAYNTGDPGSISGSGRWPEEGVGNPLQHSGLENVMDRRSWQATVHGVTKGRTRLRDSLSISLSKVEDL